jgi:diadenosine tetraphosphate (Ap4A) HIT family hydrolase
MNELPPNSCPFCCMPVERIRERCEHAFVVDDAFPVSRGHTLVILRRHTADFLDLTREETSSLLELLRRARGRLDSSLAPSGYNVGVNVGQAAGQTVMHLHVHLIPRYVGDTPNPIGGVRNVIPGKACYAVLEACGVCA